MCEVILHSGAPLTIGAVVEIHAQPGFFHVSLDLSLPVMDQGRGADDQSAF